MVRKLFWQMSGADGGGQSRRVFDCDDGAEAAGPIPGSRDTEQRLEELLPGHSTPRPAKCDRGDALSGAVGPADLGAR